MRDDSEPKCCGANKHPGVHEDAHINGQLIVRAQVKQAFGSHSVSEKQSGSERAAAGAMGWVGPYGKQQGAGGSLGVGGG